MARLEAAQTLAPARRRPYIDRRCAARCRRPSRRRQRFAPRCGCWRLLLFPSESRDATSVRIPRVTALSDLYGKYQGSARLARSATACSRRMPRRARAKGFERSCDHYGIVFHTRQHRMTVMGGLASAIGGVVGAFDAARDSIRAYFGACESHAGRDRRCQQNALPKAIAISRSSCRVEFNQTFAFSPKIVLKSATGSRLLGVFHGTCNVTTWQCRRRRSLRGLAA